MDNKIRLLTTDSYFNTFEILKGELKDKACGLKGKNLIFCDEKISLMAERQICSLFGGSFNTEVYSFGNYLRVRKKDLRALSKEGSSMAVRRILSSLSLKKFTAVKANLAPSLYELIMQLKSAKITKEDLEGAKEYSSGVLGQKLEDICAVYHEYEKFLLEFGFEDQSSVLSYLPSVIEDDDEISNANVYLLGFNSWTRQAREGIRTLIRKANSVTAILIEGQNQKLFVNETAKSFEDICKEENVNLSKQFIASSYTREGKLLIDNFFSPDYYKTQKIESNNVFVRVASNVYEEATCVAETVKKAVMEGKCRYRDVTIAISDVEKYKEAIDRAFSLLEIPYFLDEKKRADNHPLINLVITYIDVIRKNLAPDVVRRFIKNPLVCKDKDFADDFENYVIKYNVGFNKFLSPFVFGKDDQRFLEFEEFRKSIEPFLKKFDLEKLFSGLNVKERLKEFSSRLTLEGEEEHSAVNDKIYDEVQKILDEIRLIYGNETIGLEELKKVFLSGVSALKLSIIPQFNDAVFVGAMKETALAQAKYLFVIGLDSSVPAYKEDVALISDSDIDRLNLKILIEPKIKIVNDRVKESVGLAISAFKDKLFLSYSSTTLDGKKNVKSELLKTVQYLIETKPITFTDRYLTKKQGIKSFAEDCEKFTSQVGCDFSLPTAFYFAVGNDEEIDCLLKDANKIIKKRLEGIDFKLVRGYTSPTVIEDFFDCPYKAFLTHTVRLKEREEGKIDSRSAGTLFHLVMQEYLAQLNLVKDRESSDALVDKIVKSVLEDEKYSRYLQVAEDEVFVERVIEEVKTYCYKTHAQLLRSKFKPTYFETKIGKVDDKIGLKEVPLLNGEVKIKGQIDRIDCFENHVRVLDYKSGDASIKDAELFSGRKLQLYLYSSAIAEKEIAGVYYLPINESFVDEKDKNSASALGKTLIDPVLIEAQDSFTLLGESDFIPVDLGKGKLSSCVSKEMLASYIDYALKVSEGAVKDMNEGVIAPTPFKDVCKYCQFKGMCQNENKDFRELKKVDESVILQSVGVADED